MSHPTFELSWGLVGVVTTKVIIITNVLRWNIFQDSCPLGIISLPCIWVTSTNLFSDWGEQSSVAHISTNHSDLASATQPCPAQGYIRPYIAHTTDTVWYDGEKSYWYTISTGILPSSPVNPTLVKLGCHSIIISFYFTKLVQYRSCIACATFGKVKNYPNVEKGGSKILFCIDNMRVIFFCQAQPQLKTLPSWLD